MENKLTEIKTVDIVLEKEKFSFPIPEGKFSEKEVIIITLFYHLNLANNKIRELENDIKELRNNQITPPLPDPREVGRSVINILKKEGLEAFVKEDDRY